MSVCDSCLKCDNVPECVTSLAIGTISSLSTAVIVYLKNHSTSTEIRFEVTSDGAGLVTIAPDGRLVPKQSYELWIVLATATNKSARETITVGVNSDDCLTFRVDPVFGTDNVQHTFPSIQLTS